MVGPVVFFIRIQGCICRNMEGEASFETVMDKPLTRSPWTTQMDYPKMGYP